MQITVTDSLFVFHFGLSATFLHRLSPLNDFFFTENLQVSQESPTFAPANRGVAQLVAFLVWDQAVARSSRVAPTIYAMKKEKPLVRVALLRFFVPALRRATNYSYFDDKLYFVFFQT